jgi:hypothetical protein
MCDSMAGRAGKEYGRKQGKLIYRNGAGTIGQ